MSPERTLKPNTPEVFLSYSISKSSDPQILRALLDEVRQQFVSRGWKTVDPMSTTTDGDGIRDKVSMHLYNADAIFADCTTAAPNVMFEIGFARALRYPMVLFVNTDVFRSDSSLIKDRLQFIGLDEQRPLPSDLGDLEYFEYSSDIKHSAGAESFRKRFGDLLDRMALRSLSIGLRLLRRQNVLLTQQTCLIAERYRQEHPFTRFVGGWLTQINEELSSRGSSVFQVDARYYEGCLSAFRHSDQRTVTAIADLSDSTETFWKRRPEPLRTSVNERIFVIDWCLFFDSARFPRLCEFLRDQRKEYPVRLVANSTPFLFEHQFGHDGVGCHLLLIEPDVVGGYISERQRRYLRVESNKGMYERASFQYEAIRDMSIAIDPNWSDADIRRAWIQKEKIGIWNPEWDEVHTRSEDYFSKYDMHIRCWIPGYEQLIGHCAATIQREIAESLDTDGSPSCLLEIGFGTGALTEQVLRWVEHLNRPFTLLGKPRPIQSYIGVDRAPKMCELFREKLRRLGDLAIDSQFANAVALKGLRWITGDGGEGACVLLFGSLVLHDILGSNPAASFEEFLCDCRSLLTPGGGIVLADSFTSADGAERARQMDYWRRSMMSNGLSDDEADAFFAYNHEMVETITVSQVREAAARNGFEYIDPGPVPGTSTWSPFKVVILRSLGG
jgi:hypothetical protein